MFEIWQIVQHNYDLQDFAEIPQKFMIFQTDCLLTF
jgi:hypothetical protein